MLPAVLYLRPAALPGGGVAVRWSVSPSGPWRVVYAASWGEAGRALAPLLGAALREQAERAAALELEIVGEGDSG